MQQLINDLLKFSRLGQQKNPLAPVGLNAMLMHVRVNLQYALDAKKVDLRVDRLPTVVCDATAMTEVFHNLISNAISTTKTLIPGWKWAAPRSRTRRPGRRSTSCTCGTTGSGSNRSFTRRSSRSSSACIATTRARGSG